MGKPKKKTARDHGGFQLQVVSRLRASTTTPAGLFLDLYSLQGLSMNPNLNIYSFSFIPDPTSLYNMRVGELLKEDLGHMRQFQGKVVSGGDRMGYYQRTGFLATRVMPGVIGHSILRTSIKPRYIPLSNSQDPELVLLSSHFGYPSGIDPWSLVISNFEKSNSLDSGKGWSALKHPQGRWCRQPTPSTKIRKIEQNLISVFDWWGGWPGWGPG